jgi:adenylate kinase family enzyme
VMSRSMAFMMTTAPGSRVRALRGWFTLTTHTVVSSHHPLCTLHNPSPEMVRRVAIIASASGNGKTTIGRALAARLGLPFVELDAIVHGPGWTEISDAGLRAALEPVRARGAWVIDGNYRAKLGDLVLRDAELVVWLDLPMRVWLPRLVRRTAGRLVRRQALWNGNCETLRGAVWGRESLIGYAVSSHIRKRREWPRELAGYPVTRLRSTAEVQRFLERAGELTRS